MSTPNDPAPIGAPSESDAGLRVERRTLLWLPLAVAGERLLAGAPLAAQEAEAAPPAADAFAPLSLEDLGRRWQALARELVALAPEHDESYAAQLAGLVARLPLTALPSPEKPNRSPGLAAGLAWFLAPCAMIEFRMDPLAVMRPHNHPPQVVLSLCAEGEVAYRHLELEGEAPPCTEVGAAFLARETRAGFLRAGQSTSLTRACDGIHGFVAGPKGARLVDLVVATTPDTSTFSYIELAAEPSDAARRVYEARWLGKH
jgi:hypothetical protein